MSHSGKTQTTVPIPEERIFKSAVEIRGCWDVINLLFVSVCRMGWIGVNRIKSIIVCLIRYFTSSLGIDQKKVFNLPPLLTTLLAEPHFYIKILSVLIL
jgi:hypothetical protein